ncbi:MAG TPA: RagB/SusD family nutrient uptake outer membrane protein [Chitinophagales bacterium]|nr:RagB/SusD family nutrient uptake outer membrane protein [Chitinophagales bacterium]
MKNKWIKLTTAGFGIFAFILAGSSSCNIDKQTDLNFPSVDGIETNASISELNNVITGMLAGMRNSFDTYNDDVSIIGRDYYRFTSADPRFVQDLPGTQESTIDNNTFYTVNPWTNFYRVIRNGWVVRHAIANTSAPLTDEQKNGYLGVAKTIQALEFIYISNMTYDNGIRFEVEDPDNLGPLTTSWQESLSDIAGLLDEANNDLMNAGDEFVLQLSSGFAGFDTPASFATFNRALKARIDLYRTNYSDALADLNTSFYNLNGDLNTGCYIAYSTGSGDFANNLFVPLPNTPADARVAQNLWVQQADTDDLRLSKVVFDSATIVQGELSSNYAVNIWTSQNAPVSIIRNEELLLIAAEAYNETANSASAVECINKIREAAGLTDYAGPTDVASLRDEIVTQRRYSLFGEGHRWVDMRRLNRLDQIQTDNPDEDVWLEFPIPASEPQ